VVEVVEFLPREIPRATLLVEHVYPLAAEGRATHTVRVEILVFKRYDFVVLLLEQRLSWACPLVRTEFGVGL